MRAYAAASLQNRGREEKEVDRENCNVEGQISAGTTPFPLIRFDNNTGATFPRAHIGPRCGRAWRARGAV